MRVTVLALSFIHSFILSIELQRSAITSAHRLRYEQAKHDHSLQCDSWILLKRFRSRVKAGSPWRPSWTSLRTKTLIVGCLCTCTFDLLYKTALGYIETSRNSLSEMAAYYIVTPIRHTSLTSWPCGQHLIVFRSATNTCLCKLLILAINTCS